MHLEPLRGAYGGHGYFIHEYPYCEGFGAAGAALILGMLNWRGLMIHRWNRKGFTLIAAGACAFTLFGMLGLALDLGRVYIARNEAQSFTDTAALAAALTLN